MSWYEAPVIDNVSEGGDQLTFLSNNNPVVTVYMHVFLKLEVSFEISWTRSVEWNYGHYCSLLLMVDYYCCGNVWH